MIAKKESLLVIDGVGSDLLDYLGRTVRFELDGLGSFLTTTDDLKESLKNLAPDNILRTIDDYEGYVLIRR